MKFPTQLILALIILVLHGIALADPTTQQQVSFTKGTSGTWNADWTSITTNRTFFAQGSVDLTSWEYLPVLEFGTGLKGAGVDTVGAPKFFFRLVYVDDLSITTEQEARDADFDDDGLSNNSEVMTHGTDPLLWDTDGDSLSDGFEIDNGLNPNSTDSDNNGIEDGEEDGMDDDLSNLFEQSIGSNPSKSYEVGTVTSTTPLQIFLPSE